MTTLTNYLRDPDSGALVLRTVKNNIKEEKELLGLIIAKLEQIQVDIDYLKSKIK